MNVKKVYVSDVDQLELHTRTAVKIADLIRQSQGNFTALTAIAALLHVSMNSERYGYDHEFAGEMPPEASEDLEKLSECLNISIKPLLLTSPYATQNQG